MRPYGIYIAFISWGDGGKRRPVLVLSELDGFVSAFRITSQFERKSEESTGTLPRNHRLEAGRA